MFASTIQRLIKSCLAAACVALVMPFITASSAIHAAPGITYTVLAGGMSMTGGIEMVAFAPQTLQVHRGDTITWKFGAIHNVRFATAPMTNLIKMGSIDGNLVGEIDPVVALPNVKNGDAFTPGAASGLLGLPGGNDTFSLVMDTAPGTYTYLCDIHPGMVGYIQVVDDNTNIPTPDQVAADEQAQFSTAMSDGQQTYVNLSESSVSQPDSNTLIVMASGVHGTTVVHRFFPAVGIIHVGQTVTWTVPLGLVTATVNFGKSKGGTAPPWVQAMTDKSGGLHFLGDLDLMPTANDGEDVTSVTDNASTGLLLPGKHFTLKFPNPGIYHYYSAIHQGQSGTIVVLPTDQP